MSLRLSVMNRKARATWMLSTAARLLLSRTTSALGATHRVLAGTLCPFVRRESLMPGRTPVCSPAALAGELRPAGFEPTTSCSGGRHSIH